MMQNATVNQSGANHRALPPALNPESGAIVQPYKEFLQSGWIKELVFKATPLGFTCTCRISEDVDKEKSLIDIPPGMAKELIMSKGLWSPRKGKTILQKGTTTQSRPKRSLTVEDFKDGPGTVKTRVLSIAKETGDQTARGRIGSLQLMVDGADTFEKWWAKASAGMKLRLFSDDKHFKTFNGSQANQLEEVLSKIGCPFRGPVPTPTSEEQVAKA